MPILRPERRNFDRVWLISARNGSNAGIGRFQTCWPKSGRIWSNEARLDRIRPESHRFRAKLAGTGPWFHVLSSLARPRPSSTGFGRHRPGFDHLPAGAMPPRVIGTAARKRAPHRGVKHPRALPTSKDGKLARALVRRSVGRTLRRQHERVNSHSFKLRACSWLPRCHLGTSASYVGITPSLPWHQARRLVFDIAPAASPIRSTAEEQATENARFDPIREQINPRCETQHRPVSGTFIEHSCSGHGRSTIMLFHGTDVEAGAGAGSVGYRSWRVGPSPARSPPPPEISSNARPRSKQAGSRRTPCPERLGWSSTAPPPLDFLASLTRACELLAPGFRTTQVWPNSA